MSGWRGDGGRLRLPSLSCSRAFGAARNPSLGAAEGLEAGDFVDELRFAGWFSWPASSAPRSRSNQNRVRPMSRFCVPGDREDDSGIIDHWRRRGIAVTGKSGRTSAGNPGVGGGVPAPAEALNFLFSIHTNSMQELRAAAGKGLYRKRKSAFPGGARNMERLPSRLVNRCIYAVW